MSEVRPHPPWDATWPPRWSLRWFGRLVASVLVFALAAAWLVLRFGGYALRVDRADDPRNVETFDEVRDELDASEVLAVVTFRHSASEEQVERVEREWEASGRLRRVSVIPEEEIRASDRGDGAAVWAVGDAGERDAIERFVCGYLGDGAVSDAGVGEESCPAV